MAEPSEVLAGLTPLAQIGYGIATFITLGSFGLWQLLKTKREEREKKEKEAEHEPEHFDPSDLLAALPVVKFFANVEELAVNTRLMAEGIRNISAVATIAGKRWENGYDEMRVWKAVDDRWRDLMDRKDRQDRRRGSSSGGWGSGGGDE